MAKPLRKRDLRNVYGGFRTEGEIEKTQKEKLDELWDCYTFKDETKSHLTNDGNDFFKDVEVNILSYLLIDGTSIKTVFNGVYDMSIKDMLSVNSIEEKLSQFLSRKIAFIDKYLFYRVKKDINNLDFGSIVKKIDKYYFKKAIKIDSI